MFYKVFEFIYRCCCREGEKKIKIAVIGGDRREEVLIKSLAERGFNLSVFSDQTIDQTNIVYDNNLKNVLVDADVVIAPMSSTDKDCYLKSTFVKNKIQINPDFFNKINKKPLFLIGFATEKLKKLLESRSISYIELARLENLAVMNAIPTAEAAIKIGIEEMKRTIHGSRSIVYGLGKVGLTLAWRLRLLGSDTHAVTRNKVAIARGKDLGLKMISYESLSKYLSEMDIVYNTVPAMLIDSDSITLLDKDSVIIDLASYPGGTDFVAAEKKGIKAIHAIGLPGKVAPLTAGKILAEIIPGLIK